MIFEAVILFSDTFKRDGEMSQKDDEEMCKILIYYYYEIAFYHVHKEEIEKY